MAGFVRDAGSTFSNLEAFCPAINRLDLAAEKRTRVLGLWAKAEFYSILAIIDRLERKREPLVRLDDENPCLAEKVL